MRTPFRLVSLLLLSGLALLSGCRGSRKDVIRVATFGDPEMQSIARARLDELEKRSGIHAELSFIPYTSYSQKIITQLSAGKAPDVVWVEVSLYTALQNAGALVPLNDLVEKNKIDLSLQYPQVLERFSKDGKVYALPQDTAPIACLYYNRKMFREAGLAYPRDDWRWSDLVAAAKKLTKRGADGRFQVYGFEDNGQPGQPDWPGIVYANGGTLVDDWRHPTRCTLDQPAAVEAIQFLSDIVNVHHISQLQANRESMLGGSQETFGAGRLAMFAGGIWFTPALRKVKDLDWDIAPMPMGPSAKHPGWGTGGSGWSITIDSKDKDKAWKVASFLASEESQREYMKTGFAQPSLMALAKSPEFLHNAPPEHKAFLVDAPKYAIYNPVDPRWDEIAGTYIEPNLHAIFMGEKKAGPVLKEISAKINAKFYSSKTTAP